MPISSINILVDEPKITTVLREIETMPNVEVVGKRHNYVIAVLETDTDKIMKELFETISGLRGVINTQIAYYHSDLEESNSNSFEPDPPGRFV